MSKIKTWLKNFIKDIKISNVIFAFLGGIILAFFIRNVHTISPITEGGLLGLTLLVEHWLHISPSITTPIVNVICYLIGYKILGKTFIFYSLWAIGGYAGFLAIFELFPPLWPEIANMPFIASIIGGIGVGVSCGICVLANSAPTADDAIVLAIQDRIKIKITYIYMVSDLVVLLASLSYIPWQLILYSLLTVTISGQIIGLMQWSFNKIMDYKKYLKEQKLLSKDIKNSNEINE